MPYDVLEELLEAASKGASHGAPERLTRVAGAFPGDFEALFQEWAADHRVSSGCYNAIPASDLHRHFLAWCETVGHPAPEFNPTAWGVALKARHLRRGRKSRLGRDSRPYMMGRVAAAYFREWLEGNPPPPLGQTGFEVHKGEFHRGVAPLEDAAERPLSFTGLSEV